MTSKARDFTPAIEPDTGDANADNVAATNAAAPVRYLAGTRKLAVTWIGRVYNIRAVPAPNERPAKK
jgi:hypothetical protein